MYHVQKEASLLCPLRSNDVFVFRVSLKCRKRLLPTMLRLPAFSSAQPEQEEQNNGSDIGVSRLRYAIYIISTFKGS